MAHIKPSDGVDKVTGALSKKKNDSRRLAVARVKHFKDPLTGETVGEGPNELFLQSERDMDEHPLTEGEKAQRGKWSAACKAAKEIVKDRSHPRFMELYQRWRGQLGQPGAATQFPNYVRATLVQELRNA